MLLSMVPISFGGWGVREAAMMWLFSGAERSPRHLAQYFGCLRPRDNGRRTSGVAYSWLADWLRPTHARVSEETPSAAHHGTPRILAARTRVVSPWMSVVEREVDFGNGRIEIYHALRQADYWASWPSGPMDSFRSFANTDRRWSASRGNCLPGWLILASRLQRPAGVS